MFRSKSHKKSAPPAALVACVFPGQGSQRVGMGWDLYKEFLAARAIFEAADEALGFSLSALCFDGPEEELRRTLNAQPAILTVSIAAWKSAQELGLLKREFKPAFVAGHSLGEYTSLVAAGVLSFPDAVKLVRERGRLMEEAGYKHPGGMVALLGLNENTVVEVCQASGAEIANVNGPGQIVISGNQNVLSRAVNIARSKGARRAIFLEVSGAFHSSLMRWARRGMQRALGAFHFHHAKIPIVANTTATPLIRANAVRAELHRQLCHCVYWQRSVEFMRSAGVTTFLEVGPGDVLSGLIQRISPEVRTLSLGNLAGLQGAGA